MQMILCDFLGSNHRDERLIKLYRAFCFPHVSLSPLNYFIGVLNFWTLIEFDCSFFRNRLVFRWCAFESFEVFIGSLVAEICEKCCCDNFQMPLVVSSKAYMLKG